MKSHGAERSQPHSLWGNLHFLLKKSWETDRGLVVSSVIQMPVVVLIPVIRTYLVSGIVGLVTEQTGAGPMLLHILILSAAILLLQLLKNNTGANIQWRSFGNRFTYLNLCCEKVMNTDYQTIEQPENQVRMQKAMGNLSALDSSFQQAFEQLVSLCSNLTGILLYSAMLFSLEPVVIVILLAASVLIYWVKQRCVQWRYQNKGFWTAIERKLNYVRVKGSDFRSAKDIRLYKLSGFFGSWSEKLLDERLKWKKREARGVYVSDLISALLVALRDACAYGLLIRKALTGELSAAEFVFFFQLITQYAGWVFGFFDAYHLLKTAGLNISEVREFLELPDVFFHGKGRPVPDTAPEIVFRNVSFQYPGGDRRILRNLNFTIRPGEKIAIVGVNGAGKSTLVKLLCGLYDPTEGEILVGGNRLTEYNREEYYGILSVVFQEIRMLPVSIAKNIGLCEEKFLDREKLRQVIALSGLKDKVDSLPEKEGTLLLKGVTEEGIELSGGETQKLALARALYKDAPVMVLDEPTSALDPLAEKEIYQKYRQLVAHATSVFISHRLSSTRFCDRIFFMESGRITEEGSHEELMEKGGSYASMFAVQSQYYKEG